MLDGRCGIVLFYVCSPWLGMGSTSEFCPDQRARDGVLGSDGTLGRVYTGNDPDGFNRGNGSLGGKTCRLADETRMLFLTSLLLLLLLF